MKNRFEIFTDSAANLPDAYVRANAVHVLSYVVTIDGEEVSCYDPDVSTQSTSQTLYDRIRRGADVKTSLIGEQVFADALTPALQAGKDAVIVTMSSGISGTFRQAQLARERLLADFPDRKICLCDSANASLGEGLLVMQAVRMRDEGYDADTALCSLVRDTYKIHSYFTVGDLKYLRKGGRISAAKAIVGSLLNIKPILCADGGENAKIAFYGKTHGRKKALAALVDEYMRRARGNGTVAIAHADCPEDAAFVETLLRENGVENEIVTEVYDVCTGAHAGPGTVALFFVGDDRRPPATSPALAPANLRGDTHTQP